MHGTYFVLKYLLDNNHNELVYQMVTKKDHPGWGYMLEQGATTGWESWEGGGSRIHDTLISVGSWFVQGVGGIRADEKSPGFRHFYVQPAPVGDLTFARSSYRSPYGLITSNWRIEGETFYLDVAVPPGSTATVLLPTRVMSSVTEGGQLAATSEDVKFLGMQGSKAAFQVPSGSFAFSAKLAR
jgi:alpha-L-rhamnosidase